jgi:hypothetical protein
MVPMMRWKRVAAPQQHDMQCADGAANSVQLAIAIKKPRAAGDSHSNQIDWNSLSLIATTRRV